MNSWEGFEITTRRPPGALTNALDSGQHRADAFADLLIQDLDGGEGWVDHRDGSRWWYPGRLAVELRPRVAGSVSQLDVRIRVVRGAVLTQDLTQWLNDLNAHALGWWWWYDEATGDLYCFMKCVIDPKVWWWPLVMNRVLPHAVTVAERMAPTLSAAGMANVADEVHPTRGPRPQVDGWLLGTQLGPRDMSASLDPWIAESELMRLDGALSVITGSQDHNVQAPMTVIVPNNTGDQQVVLTRHWHSAWGWGWQIATLTGIRSSTPRLTADSAALGVFFNQVQAQDVHVGNYFGGWVYDPEIGLIHSTFLPAMVVDAVISAAGPTIGEVAALMMEIPQRLADLESVSAEALPESLDYADLPQDFLHSMRTSNFRLGPIGWSYELGRQPSITDTRLDSAEGVWSANEFQENWNVPRHLPICSFGIFNPAGPTVGSLEISIELAQDGPLYSLFYVMRHPHSPKITWLGTARSDEDLRQLITDSLAVADPAESILGTGPEWMDIWSNQDHLLDGLREFAHARQDVDWRATADDILNHALSPWGRVSDGEPNESSAFEPDADPIECWIAAITDPVVIIGQKLFMRSAWEGALAYRQSNWDPQVAQAAADRARNDAYVRLESDVASRQ